ncbi:ABC transporter ATP-binding protein [Litorimonas sp. WD9-15]|uniref:ABC transporter ATP-binding protein n=1 Tax=Litorimonas sp. WD9-15 TaxID=3418716 RepID=UPI003CFC9C0C
MNGILILFKLSLRKWKSYLIAILALLIGTALFLLIPKLLGQLVETVSSPEGLDFQLLVRPAFMIAAVMIGQAVFVGIYSYIITLASEKIGNELRGTFFHKLLSQSFTSLSSRKLGSTATEFVSDLSILQSGLSDTMIAFFRHTIFTTGAIIAMVILDWRMALVTMVSVLVVVGVLSIFIHFATKASIRTQEYRAKTVSLLLEAATNSYVIKAYDRLDYFDGMFKEKLEDTYRHIANNLRFMSLMNPVSLVVFSIAIFVILAYGIQGVSSGRMTIGDLVAYVTYAIILIASVSQFGLSLGKLKQAVAMYEKHQPLLEPVFVHKASESPSSINVPTQSEATGYVLEDVNYYYEDSDTPALEDISLNIPAGKATLIVGESGAGKSTLAAILSGLLEPHSGAVRPTTETQASDPIAIVPQNPFLFSGTVGDNIDFGRPGIDQAAIRKAAIAAQIDSHIETLPSGYDHVLNEAAANFSRGQAQRLSLARALASNPKAILLDEATASLDVVSEKAIGRSLMKLKGEMTIIIIAHGGELLTIADHLIVLGDGKVLFEGKPDDVGSLKTIASELPGLRITHPARTSAA